MADHTDSVRLDDAFLASWNARDAKKTVSLLAENATWQDVGAPSPFDTKDAIHQYVSNWYTAFPDLTAKLKNRVVNGDHVAAEIEFTGTNSGPMQMGPNATIPPTGKKVVGKGTYFLRVANGKIAEVRSYPDTAGLLMQLGLIPPPSN